MKIDLRPEEIAMIEIWALNAASINPTNQIAFRIADMMHDASEELKKLDSLRRR